MSSGKYRYLRGKFLDAEINAQLRRVASKAKELNYLRDVKGRDGPAPRLTCKHPTSRYTESFLTRSVLIELDVGVDDAFEISKAVGRLRGLARASVCAGYMLMGDVKILRIEASASCVRDVPHLDKQRDLPVVLAFLESAFDLSLSEPRKA